MLILRTSCFHPSARFFMLSIVPVGNIFYLQTQAGFSKGVMDVTGQAAYKTRSGSAAVLSIGSSGQITAAAKGTEVIDVSYGGQSTSATVQVGNCSFMAAPDSQYVPMVGGVVSISLATASDCTWTAASPEGWVTLTTGTGKGTGTIMLTAAANSTGSTRFATLVVGDQTVLLTQPGTACSYNLAQTSISVAASGGAGSINVTSTAGCPLAASSSAADWLSATAVGSAVQYNAMPNTATVARSAQLLIAGQTVTVMQTAGTGVGAAPTATNLSPAVSSGASQVFVASFSSPSGYQVLDVVNLLINNYLDGRQACYLAFARAPNALYVVADSGDATQLTGKVMDGSGSIGNSQCTVNLANSAAVGSGTTLTLTLSISFAPTFTGNKVIYAAARDASANNSGWQTMGVHGLPGGTNSFPTPVSVSPSSGSTLTQTLTLTFQDQTSASNLQTAWTLINTAIDGRGACYVAYYRPGNQVYLYPDNGDGTQATSMVLTGTNTLSNSQCTISAQGSSVSATGNTLTVSLPVTFKSSFAGNKGIWLATQTLNGAQTSPWQALGAWQVPVQ